MCTQRYQSQLAYSLQTYRVSQSSDENATKSDRHLNNTEGVSLQDNKSKQVEIKKLEFKRCAKQSNKNIRKDVTIFLFFGKCWLQLLSKHIRFFIIFINQ